EQAGLAASGAVAGLCPMTEATLGDGVFPLLAHQRGGGAWGVGTDSHYSATVAAELRMLECGQRLAHHRRNVLAVDAAGWRSHSGRRLFDLALAGGSQSLGRGPAGLVAGAVADLVVLDPGASTLLGHGPDTVLDAWILGGDENPVWEVMSAGRWVVRDGRHANERAVGRRFVEAVGAALGP
ncbi:MAG: formimidoylglutamate deiminase, partial [Proteobacteria bacterium]|nr:formimidoylglutamate deiminase [Pseudomonadota bacterium]